MAVDIRERQYISQFAQDAIGLVIMRNGAAVDVDANDMTVSFVRETDMTTVFERAADHVDLGTYETTLVSEETNEPGFYTVIWTYALSGLSQEYRTYVEVGGADQDYDALNFGMKAIVDLTWIRFIDAFDSPQGGPHLQTYWQTNYNRGKLAKLLKIAVGTLNTVAQPYQTYTLNGMGGSPFPIDKWGPLLEKALYIETLKHLRRSYVEQPLFMGGNVTRLDRRDYLDRWGVILNDELPDFERQLEVFKIANMGLGRPAVLVSGGVYGRYGPTRIAGSVAARPRYWTRFYAVLLIAGGLLGASHSSAWSQSDGPSIASTQTVQQSTSGAT